MLLTLVGQGDAVLLCVGVILWFSPGKVPFVWQDCLEANPIVMATATPLYHPQGREPK